MAPRKPDIHTGALEFAQKEAIIKYCNAHPDVRYEDVAKWAQKEFNLEKALHKSKVSRLLKNCQGNCRGRRDQSTTDNK